MEGDGRRWKEMEGDGKLWKAMENYGKRYNDAITRNLWNYYCNTVGFSIVTPLDYYCNTVGLLL